MRFLLNKCYGGFSLSKEVENFLGKDEWEIPRNDPDLLALFDKMGQDIHDKGRATKLKVVEIPDNFTDYEINDYDGIETLIYVIDGKIYHA